MINSKKNNGYLVVGKNGFVANALIHHLKICDISVVVTSREKSECPNQYQLQLDGHDGVPDEIIRSHPNIVLLAAISSPDICANQYDLAYASNVTGTSRFIRRCVDLGARVLFFSSDTVYGSTQCPADEKAAINPVGDYAVMKRAVEELFAAEPLFRSARMSYVISALDKFTGYLTACCSNDSVADIFHPFIRSPIWLRDVLESIPAIFEHWQQLDSNIINLAGPQSLSRLDIAGLYRDVVNQQLRFAVVEPPEAFFRARPKQIELDASLLERLLGRKCFTIEHALRAEFANN